MNLTFTVEGKPAYLLIKQDPGWELQKWDEGGKVVEKGKYQGNITKAGYKKMNQGNGCYPHNIRHSLDLMMDDIILRSQPNEKVAVLDGLKEIRSLLTKMEVRKDQLVNDEAIV